MNKCVLQKNDSVFTTKLGSAAQTK